MESLGIIKGTSDRLAILRERWIAYIDYGDGYTENIITLDSQMEMMRWAEKTLEKRLDGYYHNGDKVHVKKRIVF